MKDQPEPFDAVVIGAGQAGLANSYELARRGVNHVVLERGRIGEAWRNRWDSLCMILPNWSNCLPDFPYTGTEPDGFQTRDEWVADLERYAASFAAPIHQEVVVTEVALLPDGRFSLRTSAGSFVAAKVVVATGPYQVPRVPAATEAVTDDILQLHSGDYRNPDSLPPGAVLVVGTGNSGSQIAEELYRAGRTVYLSVGYSGFPLRRYRGRDMYWWYVHAKLDQFRFEGGTVRGLGNTTGCGGGRALDLRRFARDGVHLLGRIQTINGDVVTLARDLGASLAAIDRRTDEFRQAVDAFIDATGLEAPPDAPDPENALCDVDELESPAKIDMHARGIASVVWATGYEWDLGWLRLPVLDAEGGPLDPGGVGPHAGHFFAGMRTSEPASARIGRVGQEAERIAAAIAARAPKI